jgi:hypothetical protein
VTISRIAWRPVLLAICALAALAQVADVLDATGMGGAPPWQGWWGANTGVSSKPFNLVVTSVDRRGPAARAGLRRGDLIDFRANSLVERYSLLEAPLNGRPLILSVHRGLLQRELTVVPRAPILTWNFWVFTFAALWLLLFAMLIAWRGADLPQMRLLSLWIATFVITGALIDFAMPGAWAYVLQNISASVVGPLSVALLAAFASGFARPLSRPRRIAQWLCYTFLAIFTAISLVGTAGVITLRFDPLPFVEGNAGLASVAAGVLLAALCGLLAIAASRGVERQRAVWTLVPLAAFFCFFIVGLVASASSPSFASTIVVGIVSTLVLLTAPVALTYAALSRRLIDVGFFLNRAAVFTIVSAIVIGAFVLAEWAASAWLASTTHTTSAFIGMLVALGLGISLRYIHRNVERFVDRVFFRKRHEDESALRRFAHEASYISDRATLLDRAVKVVIGHTSADDAEILVRDGAAYAFATDGRRTEVGENDPGIVALRAWNKPIDLHAFSDSQLRGEFAFPMISRGDLVGALICGRKRDGEAYAPDESEALLALAHGVGTALDTLSSQSNGVLESIRETQALMLQELQKLPQAIVSALRKNGKNNS